MAGRPLRVLLVDDDPALLETMRAVLECDSFEVTAVLSASEALGVLRPGRFDVVCSDQTMPGLTGSELFSTICNQGYQLGLVLVTGLSEYTTVAAAQSAGVPFRVLAKPFEPADLVAAVRRSVLFRDIHSLAIKRRKP